MRPTPIGPLLARSLRGRCPVCGQGPLFQGLYTLRDFCPLCGFRYRRAVEYGPDGYLSGAISLNILLTGGVVAAVLIYLAASGAQVPMLTQLVLAVAWVIVFPLVFHRVACGLWIAIDLRLNPPAPHELAAAPPKVRR